MQFIDLARQYSGLKSRIDSRIAGVLERGDYIMGREVGELEEAIAAYVGVRHAISCANGTDALVLVLRGLGIGPGDLVATTPFTFFATGEAIALVGARPLFVDIDPVTFNLCPKALERAVAGAQTGDAGTLRAVMTVDLFGLPADYSVIEPICAANGLLLVEDAAQGFGGSIEARRAGSFGHAATTSFFPAKPLGCYGDGGAVFTNDDALADMVRSLRVHGKGADKYDNVRIGTNSRLDTLQAAILLEKLAAFPDELEQRQLVVRRYAEGLGGLGNRLTLPAVGEGFVSSWAQYSVLAADRDARDAAMRALGDAGIPSAIYYAKPLHLQTAFTDMGYQPGAFPISETASDRVFSLPMSPWLQASDQDRVIETLTQAITG